MPTALQTPLNAGEATKVGKRLYRKQVLPVGSVEHDGHKLDFTKKYLGELAKNFSAGKMDQVPFTLVDEANKHSDDPEKVRGDVTGVEVQDDGLYALISMSEKGAELVGDNPKLGVSARFDPEAMVLKHVAGTLDPVVKGMKPWETVQLSTGDQGATLIDLSGDTFTVASDPANKPSGVSKDALTDEDRTALTAIAAKLGVKDDSEGDGSQVDKLIADILKEEAAEPVALSAEAQKQIDLATTAAKSAQDEAKRANDALALTRWQSERKQYADDGVPPAMLDLAEPHLSKASSVIDLSNSDSQASAMKKMLENAKGTIDFAERGRGEPGDEDEAKEAADLAAKWHEAETGEKASA